MPFKRKDASLAVSRVGGVGNAFSIVIALMRLADDGVEVIETIATQCI